MAHITLDGKRIPMRPVSPRLLIALDDASENNLRAMAVMLRGLADAAPPEHRDTLLDMDATVAIGLFGEWTAASEDDALPPADGTSSGTP